MNEKGKYVIKYSILKESLEYYSDVESDGYYYFKETGEIKDFGEDLTEFPDDDMLEYLDTDNVIQLPTDREVENDDVDFGKNLPYKFIDTKVEDIKIKKILKKAYESLFFNDKHPAFPGSGKFSKKLKELGMFEEWWDFMSKEFDTRDKNFIEKWCKEHDIIIEYDEE